MKQKTCRTTIKKSRIFKLSAQYLVIPLLRSSINTSKNKSTEKTKSASFKRIYSVEVNRSLSHANTIAAPIIEKNEQQ